MDDEPGAAARLPGLAIWAALAPSAEDRDGSLVLGRQLVPHHAGPWARWVVRDHSLWRHDQFDLEVMIGGREGFVEHLERVDGGSDDGVRPEDPGIVEEGDLE